MVRENPAKQTNASCVNIKHDDLITEFDDDIQSETGSRYSLANISRNSSVS
jgi:hypothetical protein